MKRSLAALLALLFLCTGCRTIPAGEETEPGTTAPETVLPETVPPETEIPETETELPPAEPILEPEVPEPYIKLLSGEENFTLSTVTIPGDFRRCWEYDDTHMLYMTCTPVTDEVGNVLTYEEAHLYMVDLTTGTVTADTPVDGHLLWDTFAGGVIYHFRLDEETGIAYADNPLYVCYSPGDIYFVSATSTTSFPPVLEFNPYPRIEEFIYSPCGRYAIYQSVDSGNGSGGMDLRYEDDLTTVRLFEAVMLDDTMPNGKKAGIEDVRVYNPIGFLDDTRFVYRIGGWEWTVGYGIWDLMTGQYTEFTGYGIMGVYDGYLYLTENTSHDQYRVTAIYKATPEGERTLIASDKKEDGVFWMENTDTYYTVLQYECPYWITSGLTDPEHWSAEDGNVQRCTIWSPDLDRELAVMEYLPGADWYLREGQITVVLLGEPAETVEPSDTIEQLKEEGEPYIRLLTSAEPFTVSMASLPGGEWADRWYYDDTHILWLTYDRITGEHNETLGYKNCMLSMLDLETGEITATLPLQDGKERREVTRDGEDMILYNLVLDEATVTYTAENALRITYDDGILAAEPTEISPFPMVENRIVSPDGRYSVQRTTEDGWSRAGMDLVSPDGSTIRLFTSTVLGDILPDGSKAEDIQYVRGYSPLGFLDNTRFVYTIGGWESCLGYGIYNLTTGTFEEFTEDVEYVYNVHEGHIYLTSLEPHEGGMHTKVWKVTPEGERILLASTEDDTGRFPLDELVDPLYCAGPYWIYTEGDSLFSMSMYGKGKPKTYQVWAPDMDKILAIFELDGWTMNRVFFCGNRITYVP